MATLLLRLAGPLQAWGLESKFEIRRTAREPSKSGVIGLLASALGRRRDDPIDDLNQLRFGVRVDREGVLLRDFHMVIPKKGSKKDGTVPYMRNPPLFDNPEKAWVTNRYYLSDAVFLVGLESDDMDFLNSLNAALKAPKRPLFLGRRACPPDLPLALGVRELSLFDALQTESWSVSEWSQSQWQRKNPDQAPSNRIILETTPEEDGVVYLKDAPLSFNPSNREYMYRPVIEYGFISPPSTISTHPTFESSHDPMAELR